ncbi:flagellar biosynthesis protein FlhB [Providencia vermicola]|uniref:flagellar biosynthesis protein FlhB n=1 Tax=Providencia TaxID=586 RepID=UPI0013212ADD|nr:MULTISPECIES: flagellar biosynthesis protein FlhB [unclassified Providencia]MTB39989.1 flagellar type III secretion system protein FlhB [Providencia sp. wls1949]MTC07843.1 flagellar type III secretion system protein FlhB [Providencia sp. wls1948]
MSDDSDVEKTEEPTPHKKQKAKDDGQIVRSKELSSLMMMLAGISLLWLSGGHLADELRQIFRQGFIFDGHYIQNTLLMVSYFGQMVGEALFALLPVIGGLALVGISASSLVGGLLFNSKLIKFDLKKLNPISGLKRIFSMNALSELFKAVLKSMFVGLGAAIFLWQNWPSLLHLVTESPVSALENAMYKVIFAGYLIVFLLIPMVAFDVFYQFRSHLKKLRMSRQEIKDEFKQQEGDPQIKAKIRQQQRAIARNRMMADVPQADVIVTNPTHYAVALKYDDKHMGAPKVLAKGAGVLAQRIKEIGQEYRILQLEAPPLARALYRHAEIGQSIPVALYAAVAEVLAWVYQLRRWRREGGLKPRKPKNLPVPPALDFAGENNRDG